MIMDILLLNNKFDYDRQASSVWNAEDLIQDLGLNILFDAMAENDEYIRTVVYHVILQSKNNAYEDILYRQNIFKDCVKFPETIKKIYILCKETLQEKNSDLLSIFATSSSSVVYCSALTLEIFIRSLKDIRKIADNEFSNFHSEGFTNFRERIKKNLNNNKLHELDAIVYELRTLNNIQCNAVMGNNSVGENYELKNVHNKKQSWWNKLYNCITYFFNKKDDTALRQKNGLYTFNINSRDESGIRALNLISNQALAPLATTVEQIANQLTNYFQVLRFELAFYIGALNLRKHLMTIGCNFCFPLPLQIKNGLCYNSDDLYDICLALTLNHRVVGNNINTNDKPLTIITGANRGGKSTFLRSLGIAQLLMQAGLFVPASTMVSSLKESIVTHFKREEDISMNSGKLDEELSRLNKIINHIVPNTMILFNESFAATNDREGSAIASQITQALVERNMCVFYVTHLLDFPRKFYDLYMNTTLFLRAERISNGDRTFRIIEGKPLNTSFGMDIYKKIFKTDDYENSFNK